MDSLTQDEYYVWAPPGVGIEVHLHLDLIDLIQAEVRRGFGLVRKRGEEVGGILFGGITAGLPTVIRVDDFEMVPCEHRNGPAYLLSNAEKALFKNADERRGQGTTQEQCALGYFRSHARDGMSLADEDIELMDEYFQQPEHLALLIKPAGTSPSCGGIFFREQGKFPDATPLAFPFSRKEITGKEAPLKRSAPERPARLAENQEASPQPAPNQPLMEGAKRQVARFTNSGTGVKSAGLSVEKAVPDQPGVVAPAITSLFLGKLGTRATWGWMALSGMFLLVGLIIGFQVALSLVGRSPVPRSSRDDSLSLSVTKNGENLLLRWNTDSVLVRAAQRGELEIEDRGLTKIISLDRANLANGSITVQHASSLIRFRLTMYSPGREAASESVDWKQ